MRDRLQEPACDGGRGDSLGTRGHGAPWLGAARAGNTKGVQVVLSSRMLLLESRPPRASGRSWKELEALGTLGRSGLLGFFYMRNRVGGQAEWLRS